MLIFSLPRILLPAWLVLLFTCAAGSAVEREDSDEGTTEPAMVRAWMAFPLDPRNIVRHSLVFVGPDGREGQVFVGVPGCDVTSGLPDEFLRAEPGRYAFELLREGTETPLARLDAEFRPGGAYTILAFGDGTPTRAHLEIIREQPLEEGRAGLYIYHLLPDESLMIARDNSAPRQIEHRGGEPYFLPTEQITQQTLRFFTKNRFGRDVEHTLQYPGNGRMSVVLLRNRYNQPQLNIFTNQPAPDEPTAAGEAEGNESSASGR